MREIVSFKSTRERISPKVRKHQLPKITASCGQTLFAIKHGDRYFSWCYTSCAVAQSVSDRVNCDYNPSNWVSDVNYTVLSSLMQPVYGDNLIID